ncbi:hypothetical protein F4820DRAFT_435874 [Hypoxylon rubiginosum]|uniref:Uncharacterized protein n=1 Tax=Hypoxylon rubiginosum TaxID=110542 RepID=A0ACB9YNP5_9PEZI|nr:hypothetical protein F4820DRAFT_435874 [Hypoxylon rubiginosum]
MLLQLAMLGLFFFFFFVSFLLFNPSPSLTLTQVFGTPQTPWQLMPVAALFFSLVLGKPSADQA